MGSTSFRRPAGTSPPAQPGRPALPPGQRRVEGFPRFGTHLHRPPPAVAADPVIEVRGAAVEPSDVPIADLAGLPRLELTADFHCVAGWSSTRLRWEGVAFEAFYRKIIEPSLQPETSVTHVVFRGLDGYRSIVEIEDALARDVLICDRLDGRPLDADHGAPARLVSPSQYGFVSTKHLCRIELHTRRPGGAHPAAIRIGPCTFRTPLIHPHPRARVWKEERHRYLPAWSLRRAYQLLAPLIAALSARGSRRHDTLAPAKTDHVPSATEVEG